MPPCVDDESNCGAVEKLAHIIDRDVIARSSSPPARALDEIHILQARRRGDDGLPVSGLSSSTSAPAGRVIRSARGQEPPEKSWLDGAERQRQNSMPVGTTRR